MALQLRAEGVRGAEGIVGLLRTGLPADALDALDLLKIADVGLDDIVSDPDGEDAQLQAAQDSGRLVFI